MPTQVTISSAVGITPPFSGTACNVYGNNCVYVGSGTTLPITFTLPSQFDTAPEIQLTITDSAGCSLSEIIYCTPNPSASASPTPTPTVTPTPTITPTITPTPTLSPTNTVTPTITPTPTNTTTNTPTPTTTPTPTPTPNVIQSGLVAWYDIANPSSYPGSGPDLYDLTTNNNDILLSGGTYYDALGGGSLSFDGAGDYGVDGNDPSLWLTTGITIEAFIYPTGYTNYPNILTKRSNEGYRLRLDTSGQLEFIANNAAINYTATSALTLSQWVQVVVTHGPSGGIMYYNGNVVSTTGSGISSPFATLNSNLSNLLLGVYSLSVSPSEFFIGNMGIVRLYNRALSGSEVLSNFNVDKGRFGL